jgi:hypothetical protein
MNFREDVMKRYLLLIVFLLGGCVAVPYDGGYSGYNGYNGYYPQYDYPYDGYPAYGVYSAPAYVGPSVYFGGVFGRGFHGGHGGHRGGQGGHRR